MGGGAGRAVRANHPVPSADRSLAARLPHRGGDREAAIVEKIERALAELGPDLRPALPCRAAPSVRRSRRPGDPPDGREARRAETFDVMRGLFARMAARRPLVVVWEDLHWADQAMLEFITALADGIAGPADARRAHLPADRHPADRRPDVPHARGADGLSTADCAAIACSLLSVPELPEPLEALLVRTAEGNPFFLEEVLRARSRNGNGRAEGDRLRLAPRLAEHVVPDTVQDVIRARIQRLPARGGSSSSLPSSAGSSPGASSIGSPARTTRHRARSVSSRPARADPRGRVSRATYAFRHALTHDVAYARCPSSGGVSFTAPPRGPSKSSTGTGWPSNTRCSRTTSRNPRSGRRRSSTGQDGGKGDPGLRHS